MDKDKTIPTLSQATVMCCDYFLTIAPHFGWFSIKQDFGKKILCMPYIIGTDPMLRVNNCPSCGKDVRSIELDPKLLP